MVIAHEAPITGGFGGEIAATIQVSNNVLTWFSPGSILTAFIRHLNILYGG